MKRTPIVNADDRRVAAALAHGAAVIVEAPAGYGKSHLLGLLAERAPRPVLVSDDTSLRRLAESLDTIPAGATLLVDVAAPDPVAIERLADHPDVEMMVVAGRVVGRDIRTILSRYDCLELTADDLALTDDEIASLLDDDIHALEPALLDLIRAQTAGWPAPIVALAEHARAGHSSVLDDPVVLRRGLGQHSIIDRLLRDTVAALPATLARDLVSFGLLDRFTASAFDAVAEPGAIRGLVECGVPVLETADGWLCLPSIVRGHLGDEITPHDAVRIAPHLARSGGIVPAARALVASGSLHAAAHLIREMTPGQIDEADPHALLGVLDSLGVVDGQVELGLIRARVHEALGEIQRAQDVVDAVVADLDPTDPAWTTARLEQLRHAAMNDQVGDDAELVLDLTSPEHHTSFREVLGLRAAQSPDPARVEESIGLLETAAAEWQATGDTARAALVLRAMAAIALTHLGRFPEALDAATRARQLGSHRLMDRAASTVLILRLSGFAGRLDLVEREANAAKALATSVKLPWLEHHIAAAMATASAFSGKPDAASQWATRADDTLGALRDHSTAVHFHADMAATLTIAGRPAEAMHHLDQARQHRSKNPVEVAIAETTIAARHGDLTAARTLLAELEADAEVPSTRLWRPRLEVALASGDPKAVAAARATAEMVGLGVLADRLATPSTDRISIRVLGGLEIRRGGELIPNPTGRQAELLKLLVCRGGSVPVEQAIDALWDDVPSTEVGLRRLKNPINRLREAVGADAVMRSGAAIHLGPGVDTDLARFTAAAVRASGSGVGREASVAAVDALNLYEPLLPDEPPSELVANRSTDLVATASGLFDLVLRQPTESRPSSAWLLDTARRIDLFAEPWFTSIARLAIEENNLVHARQALALARASAVELDLPDNPEIEALLAQLTPDGVS